MGASLLWEKKPPVNYDIHVVRVTRPSRASFALSVGRFSFAPSWFRRSRGGHRAGPDTRTRHVQMRDGSLEVPSARGVGAAERGHFADYGVAP